MKGRDEKRVEQENEEGIKRTVTQEQAKKITERTATSEIQKVLLHKETATATNMKDGIKSADYRVKKQYTYYSTRQKTVC